MRALRIMLVVVVVAFLTIAFLRCLPTGLNRQYFGLRHKSTAYYAQLAAACDTVITRHPPGTNKFVEVSVSDPSLPKIITDLHPIRIKVDPQLFWMVLGSESHLGFGLTWDPKWGDTNTWVLHTTMESEDTVIYSAKRSSPPGTAPQPAATAP